MNTMGQLLAAPSGSVWMPEAASTIAADVDGLFYFILYLSAFFLVLICALTTYFAIKYRRRSADQKTSPISGHHKLEITWALIPTLLLVVIFFWGFRGFMNMSVPPGKSIEVRVLAKKWSWEYDYPAHAVTGAAELVVPLNQPVRLVMSSSDILHSFFIPAFRVKKDVLPNRYTVIWFQATKLGTYDVYCTEYCGAGHSTMLSKVKVVSDDEFSSWVASGGGLKNLPPAELGKKLFVARGCDACHSITTDRQNKPGPALAGVYGKQEKLVDGSSVTVDDNYIRQSLFEPNAKVVQGFAPVMPTYQGRVNERELNALIEYIKSLK